MLRERSTHLAQISLAILCALLLSGANAVAAAPGAAAEYSNRFSRPRKVPPSL